MEWFAASLALICAGFAGWAALTARESAKRAEHSEHRLSIMRGQVAGLEASIMGLDAKHQKLAGRVYADEYWRGKREDQPELQPAAPAIAGTTCENWTTAQRDGPQSPAAKCECAYCESRRAARAAARATLKPPAMLRR